MRRAAGTVVAAGLLGLGCAASPAYRASSTPVGSATVASTPPEPSTPESSAGFAQPPSMAPRTAPVRRPATGVDLDREPAQPAPPPTQPGSVTVQSLSESPTSSVVGGAAVEDGERTVREARIGAQVQRIREEQIRLASNPGICHDVCFAAGSICLAAQEVCRLTGDSDARCARARGACADAGRQRDGSCPVCPPTH
ncbi:MAG: hypothetical protein EPO40_26245 [Myxococcaceae bacterium]|nr:MAG: hypothetical protein EPO40_26245 [Myxococcaceae bacterium]